MREGKADGNDAGEAETCERDERCYKCRAMIPPTNRSALRAEARNHATEPARLRALAKSGCAREVAANPNTPSDLLLKLAARHFDAFLTNPVLPLLLLEDPGFCLKIPASALRRLLRREQMPPTFLQTLARHPDPEVRGAARLHVAAPAVASPAAELDAALHGLPSRCGTLPTLLRLDLMPLWLLEPLGGATDNELRREVLATLQRRRAQDERADRLWRLLERGGLRPRAVNTWTGMAPNLTTDELERLARGGPVARWQAAQHPLTPPAMLQRLAADRTMRVALAALRNRSLPEAAMWAYAGAPDEARRLALARNPACPANLLDQLAHDRAKAVRAVVARHRAASDATLSRLAGDAEKSVVLAVLGNPRTGPASLEVLSRSPDPLIRAGVARHPCTPIEVCERLAMDTETRVRSALAQTGNVTVELFIRLCCDADSAVAHGARFRRGMPSACRYALFTLPNSPEELAAVLRDWKPRPPRLPAAPPPLPPWKPRRSYWRESLTREEYDRIHRAMKADTTADELAELARDPLHQVREKVAWNTRTPPEILRQLATDPDQRVRERMGFNSSTPPDVLRRLATDAVPQVRQFAAYHKGCPPDVLTALAASDDSSVRCAVAGNPGTPPDTLRGQAGDAACHTSLARNPSVPPEVLAELWRSAKADCRELLALNPSLPAALLREIAAAPEEALRINAAKNLSLPTTDAERLVDDPAPAVRRAVAERGDLREATYQRLAAEPTPGMAAVLAQNVRTPPAILLNYARHPEPAVHTALAYNSATPLEALLILADNPDLRIHLQARQSQPPELKAKLEANAQPSASRVHELLKDPAANLAKLEAIAREGTDEERSTLKHSDSTPEAILLALARSPKVDDRRHLAYRRRLPLAVAVALARDEDPVTRAEAAKRHRLPEEILCELLADTALPDYARRWMRTSLAQRWDTPAPVLVQIAREETARVKNGHRIRSSRYRSLGRDDAVLATVAERKEVPVEVFEDALGCTYPPFQAAMLQRPDLPPAWRTFIENVTLRSSVRGAARIARLAALAHPRVPPADLNHFAEGGGWLERYAVTHNSAAPEELLTVLAGDANILVREAARARLAELQRSKS